MHVVYIYLWVGLLGLAVGSFLNVVIYRLPRQIKIGLSRSFCPSCRTPIPFYDNIPLLSYVMLGGKCRCCKAVIPARYPAVELLSALIFAFFFYNFGLTIQFFVYAFVAAVLLSIIFIDVEFQLIPDYLTVPGMIIGLAVSLAPSGIGIVASVIGLLVGGGALYIIALLGDWLFKKDSMGGGDIKMAAMLGAFLGWEKVIFIFFAAAVIGLLASIIIMALSKKVRKTRVIPFGPFLALAAYVAILYGDNLIDLYINHFWRV